MLFHNPGYRAVLSAIFITHAVVILGFSLKDRGLLLLLESPRDSLKHRASPDFVLMPTKEVGKVEARRPREDFGIQVINYGASPSHPELLQFGQAVATMAELIAP